MHSPLGDEAWYRTGEDSSRPGTRQGAHLSPSPGGMCWAQAPQTHWAAVLMTSHHLVSLPFWFPAALLPLSRVPQTSPPFLLPVCAAPAPHSLPCEALHFPAPIPVMFKPLVFNTTKCNTDSVKSIKHRFTAP